MTVVSNETGDPKDGAQRRRGASEL